MRRYRRFVAPCVALAWSFALASTPSTVFADDDGELPVFELLSGSYRYVGTPEKDHAKIQKSIEAAITSLGWLGRKIAEKRLANHKELPPHIAITRAGDDVSITMGKYDAVAPIDGSERPVVGPNGRDAKLSYRLGNDRILQYFVFEHAMRKSTYRFNEAGQLVMSVVMTSEKLASPIEYELVYDPTPADSASD